LFAVEEAPASLINSCAARVTLDAIFVVGALARLFEYDTPSRNISLEAIALCPTVRLMGSSATFTGFFSELLVGVAAGAPLRLRNLEKRLAESAELILMVKIYCRRFSSPIY
jgi:hypothetical protein